MNLLQLLVQKGILQEVDMQAVKDAQKAAPNKPVHTLIIDNGFAKEEDVLPVLAEQFETDDSEIAKQAQEASVVKLVNEILVEAANERASDIHIEPEEHALRIRYRIDGILHTQSLPPEINRFQSAIISRIKIMARLNIADKLLPQDGRIT